MNTHILRDPEQPDDRVSFEERIALHFQPIIGPTLSKEEAYAFTMILDGTAFRFDDGFEINTSDGNFTSTRSSSAIAASFIDDPHIDIEGFYVDYLRSDARLGEYLTTLERRIREASGVTWLS